MYFIGGITGGACPTCGSRVDIISSIDLYEEDARFEQLESFPYRVSGMACFKIGHHYYLLGGTCGSYWNEFAMPHIYTAFKQHGRLQFVPLTNEDGTEVCLPPKKTVRSSFCCRRPMESSK